jgi:hypothetical protein
MDWFRVRDVVDMDVALHGKRFIVTEFVLVAAVGCAIALVAASPWARVLAALVAVNCITFAWLAAARRRREAPSVGSVYALTGLAMVLLFVPLLFPVAAVWQRRTS